MSGFVGADVDQLASLAQKFDIQSNRLREIADSSSSAIMIAEWTGANVDQLRGEWNRTSGPSIREASYQLSALASEIRKQAEAQRSTSGGAGVLTVSTAEGVDWLKKLEDKLGDTLTTVDLAKLMAWLAGGTELPLLDKVLGPLSIFLDGAKAAERVRDGNYAAALVNLLSAASSSISWTSVIGGVQGWSSRLGPVGFGISALGALIDFAYPISPEEQDSTLDMGARYLFGPGVSRSELTQQQAEKLQHRYDGVWGAMVMISDTMDATAQELFPWNRGKK